MREGSFPLCLQFSYNNLPASWLYNRIFVSFMSQGLVCEVVVSLSELCLTFSPFCRATYRLGWGCVLLYPVEKS